MRTTFGAYLFFGRMGFGFFQLIVITNDNDQLITTYQR